MCTGCMCINSVCRCRYFAHHLSDKPHNIPYHHGYEKRNEKNLLNNSTPSPCLTRIRFTRISLTRISSKGSHSSLNTYYETEIPSLTRIFLHFVLMNLLNLPNMIFG